MKFRALIGFFFVGFVFYLTPNSIWNDQPATGGDTGSHFYPLWVLVHQALPHFQIRSWNPGNLMGEPLLLHYFPAPFLVMALFSLLMPLGLAFNLGTLLPLFAFPMSLSFALSRLGYSGRFVVAGVAASFLCLFNEAYSMWGGNALSLLAGQYAHLYALNGMFIAIGVIAKDLKSKNRYWGAIPLSWVALCHSYVFMLMPFVFLGFIFRDSIKNARARLRYFVIIGVASLLISAWFLIPQIQHARWMTSNSMTWAFTDPWNELFPKIFHPLVGVFVGCIPLVIHGVIKNKIDSKKFLKELYFWLIPLGASLGMYFVYPHFGLVDVRVVPQISLLVCIGIGLFFVFTVSLLPLKKSWQYGIVGVFSIFCLGWTDSKISNYPHWIRWNYSGWNSKPKWPEVKNLFEKIQGDFNQARFSNEHHPILNETGTTRVFESLPLFAHRATLESLYQEANQMAPFAYYLQARISSQPSCPIQGWTCPPMDFVGLEPIMRILGVQNLILVSDEAKKEVLKNPHLKLTQQSGMFDVWSLAEDVPLVEVIDTPPVPVSFHSYSRTFLDWLIQINHENPVYQVAYPIGKIIEANFEKGDCHPTLQVDYDQLNLVTDCPGKLHLLKFAYHPTFQASHGEPLFMLSPGFIGIVPTQEFTELKFGHSILWIFSSFVSLMSGILLCLQGLNRSGCESR